MRAPAGIPGPDRQRTWARAAALFLTLLAGLVPGPAAASSTSENFRLIGQTSAIGSAQGNSAGYRLASCVNASPTGSGSSAGFRLQSGCIWVLQAATNDLPPVPPEPPIDPTGELLPVSVDAGWALLLMVLAVLASALPFVRSTRTRIV